MKRLLILICMVAATTASWSDVIFSENMGTPASTTSIAAHDGASGFQNSGVLTYGDGGAANPADVRASAASSGYTGASGGGNIFFTGAGGGPERGFAIGGINTSGHVNLSLSFGGNTFTAAANMAVEWSDDGSTWNALTYTPQASATWGLVGPIALPAGAQTANLRLRWVKPAGVTLTTIRLDDVLLEGDPAGLDFGLSSGTVNFGAFDVDEDFADLTVDLNVAAGSVTVDSISGISAPFSLVSPSLPDTFATGAHTFTFRFDPSASDGAEHTQIVTFNTPAANPTSADLTLTGRDWAEVANVAGLRALAATTNFRVTGTATLTVDADKFGGFGGNRTYPVQDASGGIILIENETTTVLTGSSSAGTTIAGFTGTKSTPFNGAEQATLATVATETEGAPIAPLVVSAFDFGDSPADTYESQFISVLNVSTASAGNWAVTNYTFTDGTDSFTVRLASNRSDLFGEPLPVGNVDLQGIGGRFNATPQFNPLAPTDVPVELSGFSLD